MGSSVGVAVAVALSGGRGKALEEHVTNEQVPEGIPDSPTAGSSMERQRQN